MQDEACPPVPKISGASLQKYAPCSTLKSTAPITRITHTQTHTHTHTHTYTHHRYTHTRQAHSGSSAHRKRRRRNNSPRGKQHSRALLRTSTPRCFGRSALAWCTKGGWSAPERQRALNSRGTTRVSVRARRGSSAWQVVWCAYSNHHTRFTFARSLAGGRM